MNESSIKRKYAGYVQAVLCLFVFFFAFLYCFENLWGRLTKAGYVLSGFASVTVIIFCFFYGKLYRRMDAWIFLLFLYWMGLSAFANFGINFRMLASRSICVWTFIVALYFVILTAEKSEHVMKGFSRVTVFGLTLSIAYILFNATSTLLSKIPHNYELRGCFQAGRLCGYGNSNIAGFACTALAMMALYSCLDTDKKAGKWFYAATFVFGCFCLGLTNCRTGIIGVSFFTGLLVYTAVFRVLSAKTNASTFAKQLIAIASAAACVWIMIGVLYLLTYIYKGALKLYSRFFDSKHVSGNATGVTSRTIVSNNSTFVSRTYIWKRIIRDALQKPRLALFGVSGVGNGNIYSIYPGYYETPAPHAHNAFLEVLRRYGVPGFVLILSLIVFWCANGVKSFFDKEENLSDICLVSAAAAMLLMSIAEQVPLSTTMVCFLDMPFFMICGYCVGKRRRKCQRER